MTREQKINWLADASNEEVISQMKRAVTDLHRAYNISMEIEAQEDYELVVAELTKRMTK